MRVLHLTTEFPPIVYGGGGNSGWGSGKGVIARGIEVAVLLVGAGGDPSYLQPAFVQKRPRSEADIRVPAGIHLCPVSHPEAEALGVRLVKEWRPDIIHLHVFWLWPLARAIRARTGIRLVYTVHSLDRAEYELGQGPSECISQWETQADLIASADLYRGAHAQRARVADRVLSSGARSHTRSRQRD